MAFQLAGGLERISLQGNLNELNQVLNNLILNARDAVLKGNCEKSIIIRVTETSEEIAISVVDSGAGVDKEIVDRIFDPFFSTKNMGDGTGLGLSVSQKIMSRHGGSLLLTSAAKPTVLTVAMPRFQTCS